MTKNFASSLSAVVGIAMYARYRQVNEYLPASMTHSLRLNKASFGLGLLSTLGVSIVGNFQVCSVIINNSNGNSNNNNSKNCADMTPNFQ